MALQTATIGPGAKNRLLKTDNFTLGAQWSESNTAGGSITAGGANNPLTGTTSGVYTLNDTNTSGSLNVQWGVRQTIASSNLVDKRLYTFSIYIKQGTAASTLINITHNNTEGKSGMLITWPTGGAPLVMATRHTNTLDANYNYRNANITAVGADGWYRVQLVIQWIASGNTSLRVQIFAAGETAANTGSIYVYGPQFEEGEAATEYQEINTTTDPFACTYKTIAEWLTATATAVSGDIHEGQLCGDFFYVAPNTLNFNRTSTLHSATTFRRLTTGTLNGRNFKYDPVQNKGARVIVGFGATGNEYGIQLSEDYTELRNFAVLANIETLPTAGVKDLIKIAPLTVPSTSGGANNKLVNMFISCERGAKPYADFALEFTGVRIVPTTSKTATANYLYNCIIRGGGNSQRSAGLQTGVYFDAITGSGTFNLGGLYNCVVAGMNPYTAGKCVISGAPSTVNAPIIVNCYFDSGGKNNPTIQGLYSRAEYIVRSDTNTGSLVGSFGNVAPETVFINPEACDYRPKAGSILSNTGSIETTAFTNGPGNSNDFNGNTRPTNTNWDIGVYDGVTVVSTAPVTLVTKTIGKGFTRDYPNIATFVKNLPPSLPYVNQKWVGVCYDDGLELLGLTTKIDYANVRVDAGRNIEIKGAVNYNPKTNSGSRTEYKADQDTVTTDRSVLWITCNFTKITGIYLRSAATNFLTGGTNRNVPVIELLADYCTIDSVYATANGNIAPNFSPIMDIGGMYNTIVNCIAVGSGVTGTGATIGFRNRAGAYGNQFLHCNAYKMAGGTSNGPNAGFLVQANWKFTRISGCIACDTTTGGTGPVSDFSVGASVDGVTDGNAEAIVLDHCISSDASAVGVGSKASHAASVIWNNAPNNDFRLKIGSPAANAGANLSGTFSLDMLGNPRETPFDIGAIEGIAFSPLLTSPRAIDAHRYCTLWDIIRKDGTAYYFCSTNEPIIHKGVTYVPTGGTSASARRMESGLKEHNVEIMGAISSTVITNTALAAGLFNAAKVVERVIDWKYPFTEPYIIRHYTINSITYDQDTWKADLVGPTHALERKTGELITKGCPYQLGDSDCQVVIQLLTELNRSVTTVTDTRREFTCSSLTSTTDDYYGAGRLTWITGNNAGTEMEIKKYTGASKTLRLMFLAPFDIQVGDTFTIIPGCRKRFIEDCVTKYNNGINFGGRPHIPGTDKAFETPVR